MRKLNTKALVNVDWPVEGVCAFSTTRQSPVPNNEVDSIYGGFNLALHVGDEPEYVEKNRLVLLNFLPKTTEIQWLEQVHSAEVHTIKKTNKPPQILQGDALVTRDKHLALAVMTADCLPILLADKSGREIAAIHGGWKPLAKGIIKNTITKMHTPSTDIVAWLGPAIGPTTFEVGADVYEAFVQQSALHKSAFSEKAGQHKYLANLAQIAEQQLQMLGVTSIRHFDACTVTQSNRYYSYRKQATTGRMATIIARK